MKRKDGEVNGWACVGEIAGKGWVNCSSGAYAFFY